MAELIITNGDVAADLLAASGKRGTILSWRDVLHEGPVIRGFALAELSQVRASYLGRRLGLDVEATEAEFAARDAVIMAHGGFERIEIWLEHDLYDQLQLLQLLAFFAGEGRDKGLILVQADDFLGRQEPTTILRFAERAQPVHPDTLKLAATIWDEFGEESPVALERRVAQPIEGLPFMRSALLRMLEELPDPGSGLGRTEATALALLSDQPSSGYDLFRRTIATEEAAFMGDLSFVQILGELAFCRTPLIEGFAPDDRDASGQVHDQLERPLALTRFGEIVLAGAADHIAENGIDRWWGGTRLEGNECWRYDRAARRLHASDGGAARLVGE